MKKWKSWRSEYAKTKFDVIIIGSGISGLTAGVLLSEQGKKVLILEKHFKAGGWTHTFKRNQYEWDVGIHYIGEVHSKKSYVRKLFDHITQNKLDWKKMDDTYDQIIFPDQTFNFTAPREKFIEDMTEYFPKNKDNFIKYLQMVDDAVKNGLRYFSNKGLPPIIDNIFYKQMTKKYFRYSDRTTRDVILDIFNNEQILGVLTGQWGDYGLPPQSSSFAMHAMVVRHYLDGGNYPIGSSRKIAETVIDNLENKGGELYVNAGVEEILIHNNKAYGVRLENGNQIEAKIVISSAGVINTFQNLIGNSSKKNNFSSKLKTVSPTPSYICLYMGLKISPQELKKANTNLWIYPGYNHDQNLIDYLKNDKNSFPLLYISFPSGKDPEFNKNYPNLSTMEAITVASYQDYKKWGNKPWKKRGEKYEKYKEELSQRILKEIFKYVPNAQKSLDYYELSTPLSVKSLANYQEGELYGLNHDPNRFRQKWLKPRTGVKNLYLTGQDILSVGVTSCLFSGLLTTSAILKKNLMKKIL